MQGKVKLQHYVPRVYLREFAKFRNKDNFYFWVFDKQTGEIFNSNIKDIAREEEAVSAEGPNSGRSQV